MWPRVVGGVLGLIFLCCLCKQGEAILCWTCRSDTDPACGDPFDNKTFPITDCSQEKNPVVPGAPKMCRKIRQKVNGKWRFIRSCAWLGEPGIDGDERYCLLRTGTWDIHMEYCTCMAKDGCNSASTLYGTAFLLFLAIFCAALCNHWHIV